MKYWLFNTFILLLFGSLTWAQTGNYVLEDAAPQINLKKKIDEIVLDGELNEETWKIAQVSKNFTQYFPTDSLQAIGDTEIYMSYDENNFYIAAKCYTPEDDFRVESLKRDYGFGGNDNISFLFDTYNDITNAFLFGMNPVGARREALISNGGKTFNSFDASWDNKWDGDSKMYDNYWICELAIPFSSIRYKEGTTKWRFNSYRNDAQTNEITCFINIPRENILMNLNFMADLNWEEPLSKPSQNTSIIPYAIAGVARDFEDTNETEARITSNVGGDAKISVSSSLNLDLTLNPDFSQVEVDQQVANLDRFEIFLPERRQFFLENADLFSQFGIQRARPFFSRRIGVSIDTVTENNIQNTIFGGARLSGKINENLRIGILNMQTAAQRNNDLPSFNYLVAAAEQQVFDRSNIGFLFVNKQGINTKDFGGTVDDYDRIAGIEYRLNSKDNFWTGKLSHMQAITPNDEEMKFSSFGQIEYNQEKYRLELATLIVGEGYDAEVGFVPRRDYILFSPEADYRIFPKTDKIGQMTFSVDTRLFYKLGRDDSTILEDFGHEETNVDFDWDISFSNNHRFNFSADYAEFILLNDFDPTRIQDDDIFLAAGSEHSNLRFGLSYRSDRRRTFYYEINPLVGRFFGGIQSGVNGEFSYRFQPFGSLSLTYNYNHIDLGTGFDVANLWLVGPRLELTFSKKLFWTTFVQYNNRIENLNINSRFQWRFAPVSDFFIVYTDNYNTELRSNVTSRNRTLVAKLTYWLNL